MTPAERRAYAEAECEEADLTPAQQRLAVEAALSTGDFLGDDDFEQCVADCIQGAAETDEDVLIPTDKLR